MVRCCHLIVRNDFKKNFNIYNVIETTISSDLTSNPKLLAKLAEAVFSESTQYIGRILLLIHHLTVSATTCFPNPLFL